MKDNRDLSIYLEPTYFIDSDSPAIIAYASATCHGKDTDIDRAIALYYGVRDDIRYDPYSVEDKREALRASSVLKRKAGFCVAKAVLLTAVLRSQKIPARLGFADVRNHLVTQRLKALMEIDLFIYHGYIEVFLNDKWVKATPAFNLSLCQNFNVKPLEFDGIHDSIFHEFDTHGNRHMEYVNDHGTFADLPYETIFEAFKRQYPKFFALNVEGSAEAFSREALSENY
ncbi:MAG: transglutaminase family protein [Desulfobacterales bacterium]|jgi:transglutaminase-like putative cysteine protease